MLVSTVTSDIKLRAGELEELAQCKSMYSTTHNSLDGGVMAGSI